MGNLIKSQNESVYLKIASRIVADTENVPFRDTYLLRTSNSASPQFSLARHVNLRRSTVLPLNSERKTSLGNIFAICVAFLRSPELILYIMNVK